MDLFNSVNGFLGGGSALGNLANTALSGLVNGKPKPAPTVSVPTAAPIISVQTAPTNNKMIFGIVGGALGLIVVLFLVFKKR